MENDSFPSNSAIEFSHSHISQLNAIDVQEAVCPKRFRASTSTPASTRSSSLNWHLMTSDDHDDRCVNIVCIYIYDMLWYGKSIYTFIYYDMLHSFTMAWFSTKNNLDFCQWGTREPGSIAKCCSILQPHFPPSCGGAKWDGDLGHGVDLTVSILFQLYYST